jgi:hypothetical protein
MDSRRIPRDKRKFLKYDSQRSGFTYFKRELVKEDAFPNAGFWVHPDEKDEPAPHKKYIGGEGEVNTGEQRANRKDYPTAQTEIWSP